MANKETYNPHLPNTFIPCYFPCCSPASCHTFYILSQIPWWYHFTDSSTKFWVTSWHNFIGRSEMYVLHDHAMQGWCNCISCFFYNLVMIIVITWVKCQRGKFCFILSTTKSYCWMQAPCPKLLLLPLLPCNKTRIKIFC